VSSNSTNDSTDTTRRDALARHISTRIPLCTEEDLRVFDALLVHIEQERDGSNPADGVIAGLRRDRYEESDGVDAVGIAYRKGWSDCSRHDEAMVRVERGLAELRRQAQWLRREEMHRRFDVGGEA
jgi:hypothetical protein